MQRYDTVYLRAKGLKTCEIHELTGRNVKTIRVHLHLYKNGGIEGLTHRTPYRPTSKLEEHKHTIEQEFRVLFALPPPSKRQANACFS